MRKWNEHFPPGTAVVFLDGRPAKTWSWAGLGKQDEPVVFLEDVEEAVPLARLDVPGWHWVTGRAKVPPPKRG